MSGYGVIFDMDGVLVDSYRAHFESWRRLARSHGLEITAQQFAATFGQTSRAIISQLWAEQVEAKNIPAWDAEKEDFYRRIIASAFPEMDGAGELLAELARAGMKLAIGSSGPAENVEVVMRCLRNSRLISATVNGHDVTHGKPDPEVFLIAAERLGLEGPCCAVVEDAPAGLEAARRAGMAAIAITGTAGQDTLAPAADKVVKSLRELSPAVIENLIRENANRQPRR